MQAGGSPGTNGSNGLSTAAYAVTFTNETTKTVASTVLAAAGIALPTHVSPAGIVDFADDGSHNITLTAGIPITATVYIEGGGAYVDIDPTLAANSDSRVASQKAVKTYADSKLPALANPTAQTPVNIAGTTGQNGQRVSIQPVDLTANGSGELQIIPGTGLNPATSISSEILLLNVVGDKYERSVWGAFGNTWFQYSTAHGGSGGNGTPRALQWGGGGMIYSDGRATVPNQNAMLWHGDDSLDINGSTYTTSYNATAIATLVCNDAGNKCGLTTVTGTAGQTCTFVTGWDNGGAATATVTLTGTDAIADGTALVVNHNPGGFSPAPTTATAGTSTSLVGSNATGASGTAAVCSGSGAFTATLYGNKTWSANRTRIYDPTNTGKSALIVDTRTGTPASDVTDQSYLEYRRGGTGMWRVGLNTASLGVDSFDWFIPGGSTEASLRTDGTLYINRGIAALSSGNNGLILTPTTGVNISRNIADSNAALIVNQTHASSTGNIVNFQAASVTQSSIDKTGKFTGTAAIATAVPTSAGCAVTVDGQLCTDATQENVAAFAGGLQHTLAMFIPPAAWSYTQFPVTDKICALHTDASCGNGADATSDTPFASTMTIPANYLKAGKIVRLHVAVNMVTTATVPTLQLKLKLGGTSVFATASGFTPSALTTGTFEWVFEFTPIAAPGSTVGIWAVAPTMQMAGMTTSSFRNSLTGPTNVATNGSLALTLTTVWGANTTGNTSQLAYWYAEVLN